MLEASRHLRLVSSLLDGKTTRDKRNRYRVSSLKLKTTDAATIRCFSFVLALAAA